jgi:hypothetical protein
MISGVASTPTITENGVEVSVGIQGINTGSAWYWSLGSTSITQDPSGSPLSSSVTLSVTAPLFEEGIVAEENAAAVLLRQEVESGTGLYENVIQQDNPATETEGQTLAAAIAGQYGEIPRRIEIKTYRPGLKIGQKVNVKLSLFGIVDEPFCISDVQITTDGNLLLWTVTAVGSPLINWDYRSTIATLRPATGGGGGGGGVPSPQMYWRTIDVNNTAVGLNIAPNLNVQGTGKGIKIIGVLRQPISADLVVRVNVAGDELGTLTIPAATPVKTKVETPIVNKTLVQDTVMTWDIVSSDGSRDSNSIASVTVEWGSVTQISIMGEWKGPWDMSANYALGDTVQFDGSSYISLQDDNSGNTPDPGGTAWWDLVALKGDPGTGVPAGGTTGQVLTKVSDADFDVDWEDIPEVLTTKGDLETVSLSGSPAAASIVRFPVGSNGDVLTADSTQDTGLAWQPTKIEVQSEGISIGTQHAINFIAGAGITISVVNDPVNGRVNIIINAGASPTVSTSAWTLLGWSPVVGGVNG